MRWPIVVTLAIWGVLCATALIVLHEAGDGGNKSTLDRALHLPASGTPVPVPATYSAYSGPHTRLSRLADGRWAVRLPAMCVGNEAFS